MWHVVQPAPADGVVSVSAHAPHIRPRSLEHLEAKLCIVSSASASIAPAPASLMTAPLVFVIVPVPSLSVAHHVPGVEGGLLSPVVLSHLHVETPAGARQLVASEVLQGGVSLGLFAEPDEGDALVLPGLVLQ